jgi:hypothetical protein
MRSSKSKPSGLIRHWKLSVLGSWLISVVVTVFVLTLAEFGAPTWVFITCGLWMFTLGLPTILSVLVLVGVWGRVPGIGTPSLGIFSVCVVLLSITAQAVSFHAAVRVWNRWRES